MHPPGREREVTAVAVLALCPERGRSKIVRSVEEAGWNVIVVSDGAAALTQFELTRPRLLLVDAELPDLEDGRHPAQALGATIAGLPAPRPKLVLLASRYEDHVAALADECGAYRLVLTTSPTVRGGANRLEEPGVSAVAPERGENVGADASRELWVVDDSQTIRLLVRRVFERAGWSVKEFEDLTSAHAELGRRKGPDAVVLDVYLPDGNGLDHVHRFTRDGSAVVVLTNLAGPDQVDRALRNGAADIVAKPVDMRVLLTRVEWASARARVGATGESPLPVGTGSDGRPHPAALS